MDGDGLLCKINVPAFITSSLCPVLLSGVTKLSFLCVEPGMSCGFLNVISGQWILISKGGSSVLLLKWLEILCIQIRNMHLPQMKIQIPTH